MVCVTIAIPSYRRPCWLARLLKQLERLDTTAAVRVLVADNDPDLRQGEATCRELREAGYRWPLDTIVVAERGISQARNALVSESLRLNGSAFFLAMLDDDEWPSQSWLEELLAVQRQTDADIVQGPVICEFEERPTAWAQIANTNVPPRVGSGPIARADAGGNVLVSHSCLTRESEPWFDPRFGLTGGEDKDFFVRMAQSGARFAWAADAVAYTSIPESRMSVQWALMRAFRAGNCDMRITRKYDRRGRTLAREVAKLCGALLLSPLEFCAFIAVPHRRSHAVLTFARALGKAVAPLGGEYREYENIHGV